MSDWQEKIIAAKREGDQLKEKIRQKKDDLNDADRNLTLFSLFLCSLIHPVTHMCCLCSSNNVKGYPSITPNCHENPTNSQGPSWQKSTPCIGQQTDGISFLPHRMVNSSSGMHIQPINSMLSPFDHPG